MCERRLSAPAIARQQQQGGVVTGRLRWLNGCQRMGARC